MTPTQQLAIALAAILCSLLSIVSAQCAAFSLLVLVGLLARYSGQHQHQGHAGRESRCEHPACRGTRGRRAAVCFLQLQLI